MIGWGKWEVHIRRPMDRLGGDIIIARPSLSGREYQVMNINERGECTGTDVPSGEAVVQPSMRIGGEEVLREIIAAFTEAGKEFGVRAPDESHNAGKLEAMTDHLADMRKLVFEDKVEVRSVPEDMWKGKRLSQLNQTEWIELAAHFGVYIS